MVRPSSCVHRKCALRRGPLPAQVGAQPCCVVFAEDMSTASPTPSTLSVGSSQLGYRCIDSGGSRAADVADIVFIHGWPLHRETWRDVATGLRAARCHLIDLPGCGDSLTPPSAPVSLRLAIDAVVGAVEELDLERVVLVGHDSGGLIARFAAVRLGSRVQALVLSGTEIPHHHPPMIERLQAAARLPGAGLVTRLLMNSKRIARLPYVLGGCFHDRDLIEGDFRAEVLDTHFKDPAAIARQLELLASYSTDFVDEVEAAHADISCPVLMIWGERDPFFPVKPAQDMAGQFAGPVRFETVANARLLVHEEHPDRFAELMNEFLAQAS